MPGCDYTFLQVTGAAINLLGKSLTVNDVSITPDDKVRRKGEWGALLNVYLMITVNALFHGIIINEYYPHLFSVCEGSFYGQASCQQGTTELSKWVK